jgi:hypothetical protein
LGCVATDGKAVLLVGIAQGEYIGQKLLYDWEENLLLDQLTNKLADNRNINQVIVDIDKFYTDNPTKQAYPVCLVYLITLDASKIK